MTATSELHIAERLRRALVLADEYAAERSHAYVGCEHLLIGISSTGEGVAEAILRNLGLSPDDVRWRVDVATKRGSKAYVVEERPKTSRCKRALVLSEGEARRHGHSYLGTEHVLIGLLAEGCNIAAMVLAESGITEAAARDEMLKLLGPVRPPNGSTS